MIHLLWFAAHLALAQSIPLQNLTPDDFRAVSREFSANALFTDASGAGTLGSPLSFEAGALAGITNTPRIDALTKDAKVPRLPNGFVYGALALPLALTAQVGWLPKIGGKDFRYENFALALKWTPTELFFAFPLDVSVRGQFVNTGLNLNALVDQVRANASFHATLSAVEARASKNLGILTPFVGVGLVQGRTDMNATGALVFDPAYTRDQREAASVHSGSFAAGLELHLIVLAAGVEYQRAFATDRFTAKLGIGF